MLTERQATAAKPRDRDYKLADAGGLHLHVRKGGGRSWRFKYRFGGKERLLVLGTYPGVSLAKARLARDEAKALLRGGRDPGIAAKAGALRGTGGGLTFEQAAREWHASQLSRWTPVHQADVLRSMERDMFPLIGAVPLADVDEPLLLGVLRKVEKRGAIETARRLRQRTERVFRYARALGKVSHNPAVDVAEALMPVPTAARWPAIVDLAGVRALVRDVDGAAADPGTRCASRFLALTAQRPGMVRRAAWAEFEGIDWADDPSDDLTDDVALWRVPAERMKVELGLKDDQAYEHVVPLSHQAVAVLRVMRPLTGGRPFVFTSSWSSGKGLSENAIGYLYNREGYKGRHVPHGWRSSFSTVMNGLAERAQPGADRLVIDRLIIDLMLAHRPSGMSESEFRYNRSAYMERRRELAQTWADLILLGAVPASSLVEGLRRRKAH